MSWKPRSKARNEDTKPQPVHQICPSLPTGWATLHVLAMQPCCVVWRAPSRAPWPWQCRWTISQDFERSARCSLQNECLHISLRTYYRYVTVYVHTRLYPDWKMTTWNCIWYVFQVVELAAGHMCAQMPMFFRAEEVICGSQSDCLIQRERETYTNKVALFTQWNWPALSGWQVNAIFLTVAPAFGQTEPHKLDNPHRKHYEVLRHKWDSMIQSSHLVP